MRESYLLLSLLFLSQSSAIAQCNQFDLGFELAGFECGDTVPAFNSERLTLEGFAIIDACESGVGGWKIAFGGRGGDLEFDKSIEECDSDCASGTVGVEVFFNTPTVLDPQQVPTEGPMAGGEQGAGVGDGVLLGNWDGPDASGALVLPSGVSRLMRITFHVTAPESPEDPPVEVELFFSNGFQAFKLIENSVFFPATDEEFFNPSLGSCRFSIEAIGPTLFRRGDSDSDGSLSVGDPIFNLSFQFLGSVVPLCLDALDFNDDGVLDVSDPVASLNHQFLGTSPPPPPGEGTCGTDTTADKDDRDLGCEDYPSGNCF